MFPNTRDQHGKNTPGNQPDQHGDDHALDPLRLDGDIRTHGFGNYFQIKLLALGLVAGALKRREGGGELTLGKFALQHELLILRVLAGK